jgi:prolipoprotein diacylglyceryl transferase
MRTVTFPFFNLKFEISKVAFTVFGFDVYKYALCIVVPILITLIIFRFNKNNYGVKEDSVLENAIIGLVFGIIGARLFYVLFNLNYYSQNWWKIFNLRDGGLAVYGGLILGIIAVCLNCRNSKTIYIDLLDFAAPYIPFIQSIGRWGNFFNIEAYGTKTNSIFRMGITMGNNYMEVHPTFLYESIGCIIICIILAISQKRRKFQGEILTKYILMYSFIRFFIEGLRSDSLMFYNLRVSQVLSLLFFVISLVVLIKKRKNKGEENGKSESNGASK